MIPYEVDPSLHDSQPRDEALGDGFSPPPANDTALPAQPAVTTGTPAPLEPMLAEKSDF
jgi:hypothetical protein